MPDGKVYEGQNCKTALKHAKWKHGKRRYAVVEAGASWDRRRYRRTGTSGCWIPKKRTIAQSGYLKCPGSPCWVPYKVPVERANKGLLFARFRDTDRLPLARKGHTLLDGLNSCPIAAMDNLYSLLAGLRPPPFPRRRHAGFVYNYPGFAYNQLVRWRLALTIPLSPCRSSSRSFFLPFRDPRSARPRPCRAILGHLRYLTYRQPSRPLQ